MNILFKNIVTIFNVTFIILLLTRTTLFSSMALVQSTHGTAANGMGGAYTSLSFDSSSIFYNWATPKTHSNLAWSLEQASKLDETYYSFSMQNFMKRPKLQIGAIYSQISNIAETTLNSNNQPINTGSTFNQSLYALYTGYHIKLPLINSGIRYIFASESIQKSSSYSHIVDVAFFKGFKIKSIPINIGGTYQNILNSTSHWTTNSNESIPAISNLGISTELFNKTLTLAFDYSHNFYYKQDTLRSGIEYYLLGNPETSPYLSIRAGTNDSLLSFGTSINNNGWIFDYCWLYINHFSSFDSSLNDSEHRFSIGRNLFTYKHSNKNNLDSRFTSSFKSSRLKNMTIEIPNSTFLPKISSPTLQKPSIFVSSEITINPKSKQYKISISEINNSTQAFVNGKPLDSNSPSFVTVPFNIKFIPKNSNEIILLTIDQTLNNKIHITGFVPDHFHTLVNNEFIYPNQPNGAFYHKIDIDASNQNQIDFDFITKF